MRFINRLLYEGFLSAQTLLTGLFPVSWRHPPVSLVLQLPLLPLFFSFDSPSPSILFLLFTRPNMPCDDLTFTAYPGYGVEAQKQYHYSQAVRIGDRIECSGQGAF